MPIVRLTFSFKRSIYAFNSRICLNGASDDEILTKAYSENWILITNDKDFGEMVYRENRPHCGVIFLRLRDQRSTLKIDALSRLMFNYIEQLSNAFVVVTETQVRFTNLQNPSL